MGKKSKKKKAKKVSAKRERYSKFRKERTASLDITMPELTPEQAKEKQDAEIPQLQTEEEKKAAEKLAKQTAEQQRKANIDQSRHLRIFNTMNPHKLTEEKKIDQHQKRLDLIV